MIGMIIARRHATNIKRPINIIDRHNIYIYNYTYTHIYCPMYILLSCYVKIRFDFPPSLHRLESIQLIWNLYAGYVACSI